MQPPNTNVNIHKWNWDIDGFLNRFVPPPPWASIPYPIAHFLGYRKNKPPDKVGNLVPAFWACIGVFCGVAVVAKVSEQIPSFREHGGPIIVGSFGAAAVLDFHSIDSPLAQPRNAVLGHVLAAVVGVAVCHLFQLLSPPGVFQDLRWLGGAVSCALATTVMALTKTVHPPAGATALLAVVDDGVVRLGWRLVPVVMLGCVVMLAAALVVNNIQRRFPTYWWTPEDLRRLRRGPDHGHPWRRRQVDEEAEICQGTTTGRGALGSSNESGDETAHAVDVKNQMPPGPVVIVVGSGEVVLPAHVIVTPEEMVVLERLNARL